MNLSPNFTLAEMTRSQAALRKGLDNTPSPEIIASLRDLCTHVLEPVRKHFGPVHVSSGYRSPSVNKAVGGAATSQHTKGEAADFTVSDVSNFALAKWIEANLTFDQLILEFGPGGWVHCSWSPARTRNQALTVNRSGTREGLFA